MVVGDIATTAEVIILGAGPGGYVAAIRAAQLGKEVVLVDPGLPGGTCLHQGCIPSKALLSAADQAWKIPRLDQMGITAEPPQVDLGQMQSWKKGIIERLSKGVKQLLDHHAVEFVRGKGWFLAEQELRVEAEYGTKRFFFDHCIIAVGVNPAPVPGLTFDGERVLTPSQALNLHTLPGRMVIYGSDYIAVEIATIFAKLGTAVQLLTLKETPILPEFDPAAGRQVRARLKKLGVKIKALSVDQVNALDEENLVVVSNGIIPRTEGLNLEQALVAVDDGFITVDDRMRTTNPAIYAVGDVNGGPPLANIAIKQGKVAAESIAGRPVQYAPQGVPRVAWTDPEVAAVGLTASEAKTAGYDVITGRFPLAANGRAVSFGAGEGFVQTVADKEYGILLGVTIVGAQASALIGEAALALEMGATLVDLAETLHPHPGLGETLQESAEAALGLAVHIK